MTTSAKYGLFYFAGKRSRQKGGVGWVYRERTPRGSVSNSERFDLTKMQLPSKISPKIISLGNS